MMSDRGAVDILFIEPYAWREVHTAPGPGCVSPLRSLAPDFSFYAAASYTAVHGTLSWRGRWRSPHSGMISRSRGDRWDRRRRSRAGRVPPTRLALECFPESVVPSGQRCAARSCTRCDTNVTQQESLFLWMRRDGSIHKVCGGSGTMVPRSARREHHVGDQQHVARSVVAPGRTPRLRARLPRRSGAPGAGLSSGGSDVARERVALIGRS